MSQLFLVLAVLYVLVVGTLICVLLFGEHESCEGTAVASAHDWLTRRLWAHCAARVRRCCGDRAGGALLEGANEACCERPNPGLQLAYLALVSGGYAVWLSSSRALGLAEGACAPAPSAPHGSLLGPGLTALSLAAFCAACFSNPGVVTPATLGAHLAAQADASAAHAAGSPHHHFPLCRTTGLPCPPRSRYSRSTGRRVAKFDHYCSWMANDVGERNHRWFLSFLLLNCALCAYGAWLCAAMLACDARQRGLLDALVSGDGFGFGSLFGGGDRHSQPPPPPPRRLRDSPRVFAAWALAADPPLAALCLFLALTCGLLAVFGGYHLSLAATNTTTAEAWRRADTRRRLTREAEEAAEAAEAEAEAAEKEEEEEAVEAACANPYDRGVVANLGETLWPRSARPAARAAAADAEAAAWAGALRAAAEGQLGGADKRD